MQEATVAPPPPGEIQVGEWHVEPELDRVSRNGRVVKLEPRVMRLLLHLVNHAGRNVTASELLEHVWPDVVVGPDSVYQAVASLRRTLGDDHQRPSYIAHVPRRGYRLIAPVGARTATTAESGAPMPVVAPSAAAGGDAAVIARRRPRSPGLVLAAASLVVVATVVASYVLVHPGGKRGPVATVAGPGLPAAAAVSTTAGTASVAVLPFLDMTERQEFGYFADGITEQLIDRLAHSPDLRVPARTSSFYFKGRSATVAEIAKALRVDDVLEGSVRREGNTVRVTAQLIRADSGYHLWSETYDRDLNDSLAVEDDIARAVVRVVQARLLPAADTASGPAAHRKVSNLLLQCRFFQQLNTPADADKAVDCYRQALAIDANDAHAWSGYADALLRQPGVKGMPPDADRASATAARDAAEHALRLDPGLAAAHAVLAHYYRIYAHDWAAARAELDSALASDPADPASLLAAASLARLLGQVDEAIDLLQRAQLRDPLNFQPYARLGVLYLYLGRLAEAEAAARRRLDLSPEGHGGHVQLAEVLLARGDLQGALAAVEQEPDPQSGLLGRALVYHALGRSADADAALRDYRRQYEATAPTQVAGILAYRGDVDQAFALLDKAVASGDVSVLSINTDLYFKPLSGDRRYRALRQKFNLVD